MKIVSAILAGGTSSRMGQDKGLLKLDGKELTQHIIDTLTPLSSEIVISTNSPDYERFGLRVIKDETKNQGPIGGLYSVLTIIPNTKILFTPCDSPFVSKELYERLVLESNDFDITYPILNGRVFPITAVYNYSALAHIKEQMKKGDYKVKNLLKKVNCKAVELDTSFEKSLINLNVPDDLQHLDQN